MLKEGSTVNIDEIDAVLREGRLSDERVRRELAKRLRSTGEEGKFLVILPKFSDEERSAQEKAGRLIIRPSTGEATLQELQASGASNLGYVNQSEKLRGLRSVVTEFAIDPRNLVIHGSNRLLRHERIAKVREFDDQVRGDFGDTVAAVTPYAVDWAQMDLEYMEAHDNKPLIADSNPNGALFIGTIDDLVDGFDPVNVGRNSPADQLNVDAWDAGDRYPDLWAPAVVVPAMRLENREIESL